MNQEERLDGIEKELVEVKTQIAQLIKAVDLHNQRHFTTGLSMAGAFISALVAIGVAIFK